MNKKINDMLQERAALTTSIRNLMDEFDGKEMPAEKKANQRTMENRFDELTASIASETKQLERERAIGEPKGPAKDTPVANDRLEAFRNYLLAGSKGTLDVYNALSQASPTQAGYLVAPVEWVMDLIKDVAAGTFMRQKATVKQLSKTVTLGFPTRTAAMASFAWGTEIAAPTPDSTLAFGKREFIAKPGTSEILISKTLLRNSPDADGIVRAEISEELAKNYETAYMTGDGTTGPLGLFVNSADGIPAARDISTGNTATEIKFDGLMNAKMSVLGSRRAGAEWIFHRTGILQLMKLKNNDGQYVWRQSVQEGAPSLLIGDPVNESEYAPSTFTTGLYVGVYGNLKDYWIVDSLAMEIQVLMELYARTNLVDYMTRVETDGAPVKSNSFARVKLG
jgi:HK97 family phage major capsid protein